MGEVASSANCRTMISSAARAFCTRALDSGNHVGAPLNSIEDGSEGNDLALAILTSIGAHDLAQLLRFDAETWQGGYAKQTDIVVGDNRIQARKQVASFRSVGDIHALDHERNICLGKLLYKVVAVSVQAIEDAEIRPLAPRLALRLPQIADQIGPFGRPVLENDCGHGRRRHFEP